MAQHGLFLYDTESHEAFILRPSSRQRPALVPRQALDEMLARLERWLDVRADRLTTLRLMTEGTLPTNARLIQEVDDDRDLTCP